MKIFRPASDAYSHRGDVGYPQGRVLSGQPFDQPEFYGWLLTLTWPEQPARVRAGPATPSRGALLDYGIRLGLAGALCTGLGFALDLDHKGWATAACLLVMRPTPEMTRLRGAGRVLAVTSGALAAGLVARVDPPSAVLALTVSGALIGLAATRPSRWYVTGGFTTFLVISLLLYGNPELAQNRFNERVLETLVGVTVALIFGVAIPALRTKVSRSTRSTFRRSSPSTTSGTPWSRRPTGRPKS